MAACGSGRSASTGDRTLRARGRGAARGAVVPGRSGGRHAGAGDPHRSAAQRQFGALEAGRFRSFASGDAVFYARKCSATGSSRASSCSGASRIAWRSRSQSAPSSAAPASRAGVRTVRWRRYEGVPGSKEWRIVEFKEHGIPVRMPEFRAKKERRQPGRRCVAGSEGGDAPNSPALRGPHGGRVDLAGVHLAKLRPRPGSFAASASPCWLFHSSNLVATCRVWIEKDCPGGALGLCGCTCCHRAGGWLLWPTSGGPLWRRARAGTT